MMAVKKSFWISLSVILLSILMSGGHVVMADAYYDIMPPVQYYNPPHERWADPDNISMMFGRKSRDFSYGMDRIL